MIRIAKRNGNTIERKKFESMNDYENDNWVSWSGITIRDINLEKSYTEKLYCTEICNNCYYFGCDWDIRCNENKKPIQQVVRNCPKFLNGMKIAKELKEKMESDNDFKNFCEICNANMGKNKESKLEIFLAIFNGYI